MITNREQAKTSTGPFVISKAFFKETVKKGPLLEVLERFSKDVVILNEAEMQKFLHIIKISELKQRVGKLGGRPKKPELTPEEVAQLSPKDRERYKMRMWKRQSRQRQVNASK